MQCEVILRNCRGAACDTDKMQSSLSTAMHLQLRDAIMRLLDAAGQARILTYSSSSGPGSSWAFLFIPKDAHYTVPSIIFFTAAYACLSRLGLLASVSIAIDTRCICGTLIHSCPAHFDTEELF